MLKAGEITEGLLALDHDILTVMAATAKRSQEFAGRVEQVKYSVDPEFGINQADLQRLVARREATEKRRRKDEAEARRISVSENRHQRFHKLHPENHRACGICAGAGISAKHAVRDVVTYPNTNIAAGSAEHTISSLGLDEKATEGTVTSEESTFAHHLDSVSRWPSFMERKALVPSQNSRRHSFRNAGVRSSSEMYSNPKPSQARKARLLNMASSTVGRSASLSSLPTPHSTPWPAPERREVSLLTTSDSTEEVTTSWKITGEVPEPKPVTPARPDPAGGAEDDTWDFLNNPSLASCSSCSTMKERYALIRRRAEIFEESASRMQRAVREWERRFAEEVSSKGDVIELRVRCERLEVENREAVARAVAAEAMAARQIDYTRVVQAEQAKLEMELAKATRYVAVMSATHPPDLLTQALDRSKGRVTAYSELPAWPASSLGAVGVPNPLCTNATDGAALRGPVHNLSGRTRLPLLEFMPRERVRTGLAGARRDDLTTTVTLDSALAFLNKAWAGIIIRDQAMSSLNTVAIQPRQSLAKSLIDLVTVNFGLRSIASKYMFSFTALILSASDRRGQLYARLTGLRDSDSYSPLLAHLLGQVVLMLCCGSHHLSSASEVTVELLCDFLGSESCWVPQSTLSEAVDMILVAEETSLSPLKLQLHGEVRKALEMRLVECSVPETDRDKALICEKRLRLDDVLTILLDTICEQRIRNAKALDAVFRTQSTSELSVMSYPALQSLLRVCCPKTAPLMSDEEVLHVLRDITAYDGEHALDSASKEAFVYACMENSIAPTTSSAVGGRRASRVEKGR